MRYRGEDPAHLGFMLCDPAAVVQASSFNGAAFRRRIYAQGALSGGLSFLHRPQACIFHLPASAPASTPPLAPASPPDATQPLPPAASSSKRSATPAAGAPSPPVLRTRSRRRAAAPRETPVSWLGAEECRRDGNALVPNQPIFIFCRHSAADIAQHSVRWPQR